ncbi:unnamed protein product [Kluyveromyces dobzhanskii CBS 2104]|uniref:Ribonuclease P protein subunit n=1 Tax=Kluyveromyces dobzhanskii CBS 2104 TaxID=1427455 RepID=A0A0A8LAW2_9SACH|nr:unnamed protein product [Kluyveromyces dobzhanskii CBS 2104]
MDRAQPFIEECLFTKCFDNPRKPIDESRLTQTLFLMPTDGGLSTKLRKKSKAKLLYSSVSGGSADLKQQNYKTINKNSRVTLKNYINKCNNASDRCKSIGKKLGITNRDQLEQALSEKHVELLEQLPKYKTFSSMFEEIWCPYMKELLNITHSHKVGAPLSLNPQQTLMKLSMADYNGCKLRVSKSKNKSLIGKEGIVIWDAQKTFIMVTKGTLVDELKCIPKKGTTFELEIPINDEESLAYTIIGDRFKYRSVDRAGRKFKSRRCDDLLYYVNQPN